MINGDIQDMVAVQHGHAFPRLDQEKSSRRRPASRVDREEDAALTGRSPHRFRDLYLAGRLVPTPADERQDNSRAPIGCRLGTT